MWSNLADEWNAFVEWGEKEVKNDSSNNLGDDSSNSGDNSSGDTGEATKTINGGPGSGNFGHAGRPGEVGGSAPSGNVMPQPARDVTPEWLEKNREFVKAQGYTDKWIDEQVKYLKQQKLKDRALKAKTVEEYDAVVKEMKASDHDYSVWLKNVGDPTRESLVRRSELKAKVVSPEQQKAVDNLLVTGINLPSASEKWLRENSPKELIDGITSAVKQAEKDGLDLSQVTLKMTDAKYRGGSCTADGLTGQIKVFLSKNDYYDLEKTAARNAKNGPDGKRWWTNGGLDSASSHEFGHALCWQAVKNQSKNLYEYHNWCSKIVSIANDRYATQSGKEYWSARGELSRNKDYKYISQYGTKNSMEIIAESHSNPSFSKYTKIVNDVLLEVIRGDIKWT